MGSPAKQEAYVCEQFKAGKTVTDLAKEFECSMQAIQRLLARNGLKGADGGRAVKMAKRRAEAGPVESKSGCTPEQWNELRGMHEEYRKTPLYIFCIFKNNYITNHPDVEFNLKVWDWWQIWQRSGKWENRHRTSKEEYFVMTRRDDSKPMDSSNAIVKPFSEMIRSVRTKEKANGKKAVKSSMDEGTTGKVCTVA